VLVPDNTLSWPEVAARLAAARNYWLCTTTPSGAPHAAPVWGVVTGQVLYLYSERRTVKARNLAADPRIAVHLESGEDVLIVRGTAEGLGTPAQVPGVVAALSAEYTGEGESQYLPDADPHQPAVGDDVAPGRLRGLTAPVDLLSTQRGPGTMHDGRQIRTFWCLVGMHVSACRTKPSWRTGPGAWHATRRTGSRFWAVLGPGRCGPACDRHPPARWRCSFRRLWAAQAGSHSLSHAVRPRRDIMESFWQVLSCPKTGSTVRARSL